MILMPRCGLSRSSYKIGQIDAFQDQKIAISDIAKRLNRSYNAVKICECRKAL